MIFYTYQRICVPSLPVPSCYYIPIPHYGASFSGHNGHSQRFVGSSAAPSAIAGYNWWGSTRSALAVEKSFYFGNMGDRGNPSNYEAILSGYSPETNSPIVVDPFSSFLNGKNLDYQYRIIKSSEGVIEGITDSKFGEDNFYSITEYEFANLSELASLISKLGYELVDGKAGFTLTDKEGTFSRYLIEVDETVLSISFVNGLDSNSVDHGFQKLMQQTEK